MKRRIFLQRSGLGALGAGLPVTLSLSPAPGSSDMHPENASPGNEQVSQGIMDWVIHSDGSFDLVCGGSSLRGCYPAFSGRPLHPLRVEVTRSGGEGMIAYHLEKGVARLVLSRDDEGLVLGCTLEEMSTAPRQVYPLAGGRLEGFDRFYKQGFGFAGPSGIIPVGEPQELRFDPEPVSRDTWSYDSYLATALIAPGGTTLVTGAFDHHDFLQRCTIRNIHRRFGLTDRRNDTWEAFLDAGFSTEEISTGETGRLVLPALHFQTGADPFDSLQHFAAVMASVNGITGLKPARFHYCSWYEHEYRFSLEQLQGILGGLENIRPPVNFQAIQIDAGYCTLGDWLIPNERWPGGMEKAFSAIRQSGKVPGIWVGPYMVNTTSRLYREHPDWLLHDLDGNVIVEWEQDTHGEGSVCILDTSHPEAFGYLRKVFRTLREWGAGYFKTDFMDWGFQDSTRVRRFKPGKTSAQYFNEVTRMIREEIGSESFWLGCISPFAPMVGYVDAIRVSNDVTPAWSRGGSMNMFREMFYGQYFNNILWQNDPDVFYLRDYDNSLTPGELESIALWAGFTGGVVNTSDSVHRLSGEKLRFLRFLEPPEKPVTATIHRWEEPFGEFILATRKLVNGDTGLLVINPGDSGREVRLDLQELAGAGNWTFLRWKPGEFGEPGTGDMIRCRLDPHQPALFYLARGKDRPDPGITLCGEAKPGISGA